MAAPPIHWLDLLHICPTDLICYREEAATCPWSRMAKEEMPAGSGTAQPGPLSLAGKGNSFVVMWNLSPALERGRVGRRRAKGSLEGGG